MSSAYGQHHQSLETASGAPSTPMDSGAASGMELTSAEVGAKLRSLAEREVTEHVSVFEDIHAELQGALNRLDGS